MDECHIGQTVYVKGAGVFAFITSIIHPEDGGISKGTTYVAEMASRTRRFALRSRDFRVIPETEESDGRDTAPETSG